MSKSSLFLSHRDCLSHGGLEHPESRRRLDAILEASWEKLPTGIDLSRDRLASRSELLGVHTSDYVDRLFAWEGKAGEIDFETPMTAGSVRAARLAVGLAFDLLDQVLAGDVKNGFVFARPPGHHARPNQGMGYCLLNTVALTAQRALDRGLKRVLILDWDVHHGNGTQEAFYEEDRVFFVDLHQDDLFPKNSGAAAETGRGKGLGYTLNLPLPHSCRDTDYLYVLQTVVQPRVSAFRPELILVSAGFDAHISDPLGSMSLTTLGYRHMTQTLKNWAEEFCEGRLILNLEGGYDPMALAANGFQCAEVLASTEPEPAVDWGDPREDLSDWIAAVRTQLLKQPTEQAP